MDNTIRVTDPVVSEHLVKVYAQIEELINRLPERRRRRLELRGGCAELDLFPDSHRFDEEGCDGQSDIELRFHQDPMVGQDLGFDYGNKCSQPYMLLDLTRKSIAVNGPARSVEVYRLTISWKVAWAPRAQENLSLTIARQITTKTQGLPTATTRRYKWSEGTTTDTIRMVTYSELIEATNEITILSTHTPP